MFDITAQVIGYCATVLTIMSFQSKSQKGIMAVQSVSTVLWTIHFFMLGAFSGCLLNLLCAVRSVVYGKRSTKKWAASISWVYIFTLWALLIYAAQFIFPIFGKAPTIRNFIIESLPAIGVIATNIGYRLETGFKVRCSQFISSPTWMAYNAFNGSVGGVITEIISLCSAVVGIVRHDIKNLGKKKTTE